MIIPFTVGYEAYFEQVKLVYHESDTNGEVNASMYAYTETGREEIILESANPYAKSLEHAIWCLKNNCESMLSLNDAISSVEQALELKSRLSETSAMPSL